MTKQNPAPPPPLVDSAAKVAALSRANSLAVAGFAALSLILPFARGDWVTVGWASLALGAGLLEWEGQRRFRAGRLYGVGAMIAAQFLLIAVVWAYAWFRWAHFDADALWNEFPGFVQRLLERRMITAGLDPVWDRPLLMHVTNIMVCLSLAFVALVYQGGLALYYARKTRRPGR